MNTEESAYQRTLQHELNWETLIEKASIPDLASAATDYLVAYQEEEDDLVDPEAVNSAISLLQAIEERNKDSQYAFSLLLRVSTLIDSNRNNTPVNRQALFDACKSLEPRIIGLLSKAGYIYTRKEEK